MTKLLRVLSFLSLGMTFLCISGCMSSMRPLYEKSKEATLQTLESAPSKWLPHMRVRFSYDALNQLGKPQLQKAINTGKLNVSLLGQNITLHNKGTLKALNIQKGEGNDFRFQFSFDGTIDVSHPLLAFNTPYSGTVDGDILLSIDKGAVTYSFKKLRNVDLKLRKQGKISLHSLIKDWLNEQLAATKPVKIMDLNLKDLPILDMNIIATSNSANIELFSSYKKIRSLPPNPKPPMSQWEVQLSSDFLSRLIRIESFSLQSVHGITIDPQNIRFYKQGFNLDLRLWKLEGWGNWWRDYDVEAEISIEDGSLSIKEPKATDKDKSQGAGMVDPIAFFAEGMIREQITKNLQYTLPNSKKATIKDTTYHAEVEGLEGKKHWLHFYGIIQEDDTPKKKSKKRKRGSKKKSPLKPQRQKK